MKGNGSVYSQVFKFQVVLEALKVEGKGPRFQVASTCGGARVSGA